MVKISAIKEWLFPYKKKLKAVYAKMKRTSQRALLPKQVITSQNCFNVPIIINNRNRFSFLKQMIEQLQSFGYMNIYVLDNDSSYPPLLEYYEKANVKVIYLKKNLGYRALWISGVFDQFKNKYYVYSDPDILLQDDCPKDFVYHLYRYLNKYSGKEKAGVALKIDDLPEYYNLKQEVFKWEKPHWEKKLEDDVYDALVDTTLALYKPLAFGNAEECSAIRVAGKLTAKHLPWYLDSLNLSEEEQYYKQNVSNTSSYWSSK